jgi:hypothetical protein
MAVWFILALGFYAGWFSGCWFGYRQRVRGR